MSFTGIEVTAKRGILGDPVFVMQQLNLDLFLRIDGGPEHSLAWNTSVVVAAEPGRRRVSVYGRLKLSLVGATPQFTADFDAEVTNGTITQLEYTTPRSIFGLLANGINKGRIELTGTRQATSQDSLTAPLPEPRGTAAAPAIVALPCNDCGQLLPAEARFCHECGGPNQPRRCSQCSHPQPSGKFCEMCGYKFDSVIDDQVAEPVAQECEATA